MTITAERIAGAVKPLEWVFRSAGATWEAGGYAVGHNSHNSKCWWMGEGGKKGTTTCDTIDDAKAAAQADYAARILAALDLQPIRAEATAAAYGAAADVCRIARKDAMDCNIPQSAIGAARCADAIRALTPADAAAWLAARDAAQFKAGQEAALKGAVKGWAVVRADGSLRLTREHGVTAALIAVDGETIRPCLILVGEGE